MGAVRNLALLGVVFAVARYGGAENRRGWRGRLWVVGLVGLVAIGAGALGAESVLDRFKTSSIGDDIRFQLWRQGFRMLAAHPLGIGRGAFERVFPVYRTLKTSFPLRFSFLENEPLQLFVDSGWPLTVGIAIAAGVSGWAILRHRRHDRVEAALLAQRLFRTEPSDNGAPSSGLPDGNDE